MDEYGEKRRKRERGRKRYMSGRGGRSDRTGVWNRKKEEEKMGNRKKEKRKQMR